MTLTAQWTIIPVNNIADIPADVIIGIPLTLTGTVEPSDALFQTIKWEVQNQGTTGAFIDNNTLYVIDTGIALLKATIENGTDMGKDYTQVFFITAKE